MTELDWKNKLHDALVNADDDTNADNDTAS